MGTGTEMILNKCLEHGLPAPEFVQSEIFKLTLWRKNASTVEKSREKSIESISVNPKITIKELATIT